MATHVLRPDNASPLRDNNDATDVTFSGVIELTLDNVALTTEAPAQARVRVRWRGDVAGTNASFTTSLTDKNGNRTQIDTMGGVQDSLATSVGGWSRVAPDGGVWTQAKVDDLRAYLVNTVSGQNVIRIAEVYVDLVSTAPPVASLSGPTGTITTDSEPDVTGSYSDAEGDPQDAAHVKIFSQAQYEAAGFNPDTSTPVADSGVMLTTKGISYNPPTLPNGTHRAYARVRNNAVEGGHWSAWAFSQFTLSVTPANAPTFTASGDDASAGNTLTVTGTGPLFVAGELLRRFEIERSADNGATWTRVVRTFRVSDGSYLFLPGFSFTDPNQSLAVVDYEAPRGVAVTYRARVRSEFSSGSVTASAWTTAATKPLLAPTGWRLKSLLNASTNTTVVPLWNTVTEDEPIDSGEFNPLDSDETVVVQGRRRGRRISAELLFTTEAHWNAYRALRLRRETLLLQDSNGRQWFIRLVAGRNVKERRWGPGSVERRVPFQAVEVVP